MPTTFKNDIERKIDIIWRFIVWVIAFLISLAICLPGIFISLQYSKDECVRGSGNINIALDWWLFIACGFVLIYMIVLVVFICLNAKNKIFKIFWVIVHLIQIIWYSIGIYLIVNSTLECKHNSLWQMSLAYCIIMGTAWSAETVWIVLKWSGCGCRRGCFSRCCNCAEYFDVNEETYYFPSPSSSTYTRVANDIESQSPFEHGYYSDDSEDYINDIMVYNNSEYAIDKEEEL